MESIAEPYIKERAVVTLEKENCNFGAGTGNPYFNRYSFCFAQCELMYVILKELAWMVFMIVINASAVKFHSFQL
jgi:hypothetical protein